MLDRPTPSYVVQAPAIPSVAVQGESARFPVRRIFCVGRNYAAFGRGSVAQAGSAAIVEHPIQEKLGLYREQCGNRTGGFDA